MYNVTCATIFASLEAPPPQKKKKKHFLVQMTQKSSFYVIWTRKCES